MCTIYLIKKQFQKIVNNCYSINNLHSTTGHGTVTVAKWIKQLDIDTSHFLIKGIRTKRKLDNDSLVEITCKVCQKTFKVRKYVAQRRITCSFACRNKYVHQKGDSIKSYRVTCFRYHQRKCVICDEQNILEVHHIDKSRENNTKENLIPLCPTHHVYIHSEFKHLIKDKINIYLANKIKSWIINKENLAPV